MGKNDVKLSQAELDALERADRFQLKQQPRLSAAPKAPPASKKMAKHKTSEANKKKQGDSPKSRPAQGRIRNRSNASMHSARHEDDLVTYPIAHDTDYGYINHPGYPPGYSIQPPYPPDPRVPYHASPLRPSGASRSSSYQNMHPMAAPIYSQMPPPFYPQGQRYVSMPESPYYKHLDPDMSRMQADYARSDSRSRSSSNLSANMRSHPVDQFPSPARTSRPPRFEPSDLRFLGGSPARRITSDPRVYTPQRSRRTSDELTAPEIGDYEPSSSSRSRSDSDSSYHDDVVDAHVFSQPRKPGGYPIKTRSATSTGPTESTGYVKTKSGGVKAIRRR